MDIDTLIDDAIVAGELAGGASPDLLAGRGFDNAHRLAAIYGTAPNSVANTWSDEEVAALKVELGKYTLEEIAARHGRTTIAVKVKMKRLGFHAPSKQPGEISARAVGDRMGMCGKTVKRLIRMGVLPGRQATTGGQDIHVVKERALRQWAINPMNFIYFKYGRIQDPHLKRLVQLAQERWDDEWWSTGMVAQYAGFSSSRSVLPHVYKGTLPAVRWYNWQVLKSDALKHKFVVGKGNAELAEWSPDGDRFIVFATAVGLKPSRIGDLTGWGEKRARFRLMTLSNRGNLPQLAEDVGVWHRNGRVWVDWRDHHRRFPGLVKSVKKFKEGRPLRPIDRLWLLGVMASWAWRFADTPPRRKMAKNMKYGTSKMSMKGFQQRYDSLVKWCPDPFAGVG